MASVINAVAAQLYLSPTLEMNEAVVSAHKAGKKVVQLSFGEGTFPVPAEMLAAHKQESGVTNYLPVAGLAELRKAVANYQSSRLEMEISQDQVIIAPGSKPLLFALFDILEGDVLLPRACWVSYEPQVKHARKRMFWVEPDEHDRHTLSRAALEDAYQAAIAAGANPRIILLNSPSNPSGRAYSPSIISTIVEFCATRGIILISDEIYSELNFAPWNPQMSLFKHSTSEACIIMTSGFSKTYSVGGWRIGYAILPNSDKGRAISKAVVAYASECWSATSAPAQKAAVVALQKSPAMEEYRQAATSLHRFVTLRLYHALCSLGLDVAEPQGGFYVYPSFNPYAAQLRKLGVNTSAELSKWLIEKWSIATLPGSVHGEDDQGVVGGKLRLKMATSYLYFRNDEERYQEGYQLLSRSLKGELLVLPLLEEAIQALEAVVSHLRTIVP